MIEVSVGNEMSGFDPRKLIIEKLKIRPCLVVRVRRLSGLQVHEKVDVALLVGHGGHGGGRDGTLLVLGVLRGHGGGGGAHPRPGTLPQNGGPEKSCVFKK